MESWSEQRGVRLNFIEPAKPVQNAFVESLVGESRTPFGATTARKLTSRHFRSWCEERETQVIHIRPRRPMPNGHVESFNGRLRTSAKTQTGFAICRTLGPRSRPGETSTIANDPTAFGLSLRSRSSLRDGARLRRRRSMHLSVHTRDPQPGLTKPTSTGREERM